MKTVLRSSRVLVGEDIRAADVIIEGAFIAGIEPFGCGDNGSAPLFDLGDRLITPGFVDLHSDAVEKEIEPRPGAEFPIHSALIELDKKLAMAGITTMFHAIAFNEESLVGQRGTEHAARIIGNIHQFNNMALSVDNLVHARYEITSFTSVIVLKELIENKKIQMLSLMDHSPGQGQFKSLEKWKQYHVPVYDLAEHEVTEIVALQAAKKSRCMDYIRELTACARHHGLLLASHDDDTCEKVSLMADLGVKVAEFPLNLETASHARSHKMATGMGAPNVVRGRSQSGNISARELVARNSCDFLCSDYHPSSMLQAVYAMHREMAVPLSRAFAYITSTPSSTADLGDRGIIAPDKLADLAVIEDTFIPKVVMTIKSGRPIYSGSTCFFNYEQ